MVKTFNASEIHSDTSMITRKYVMGSTLEISRLRFYEF